MKKLLFSLVIVVLLFTNSYSQLPSEPCTGPHPLGHFNGFNYQSIVRDAAGNPIINKKLSIKINLNLSNCDPFYIEEFKNIFTNKYGLVNLAIGQGDSVFGDFTAIDWSKKYEICVSVDTLGGNKYVFMGCSLLMSVPYALYAEKSGDGGKIGPTGPTGDKGEQGIQGVKGDKGDKGEQGIQGVKGDKGDKGDKGEQGIQGVTGEKGDKGDKGEQGIQGLKGDKGDKGEQGIQGVKGDKGDKGDTGEQGLQGVTGEKGEKGDTGPEGSSNLVVDNNYYRFKDFLGIKFSYNYMTNNGIEVEYKSSKLTEGVSAISSISNMGAGSGWGLKQSNTGIRGYALNGLNYCAGVAGYRYIDMAGNSAGVIGVSVNTEDPAFWGALGYVDDEKRHFGCFVKGTFGIKSGEYYYTALSTASQTYSINYTLPSDQGAPNTFLTNDGHGNLSWQGFYPSGNNKYIQFNDNGNFGSSANFYWDKNKNQLGIDGDIITNWGIGFYNSFSGILRPYIRKGWTADKSYYDFLYIGSTSASDDNTKQSAVVMSAGGGVSFGRGTNDGLGLSREWMRINTNGDLGIGILNPAEKIDVDGNIKLSGTIKFADNTTMSTGKMLPIAYGYFNKDGDRVNGTSNILCSYSGGYYNVSIDGVDMSECVIIFSAGDGVKYIIGPGYTRNIWISNEGGSTSIKHDFNLIVYKN